MSERPVPWRLFEQVVMHERNNPSVFGKFSPESTSATRFVAVEKAPEVFLR